MTEPILGASHSKLNWWLKVGPARPDGFHELETVFQQLKLAEQVTICKTHDEECILTGFPDDIPAESNLVTRAWRLMKAAFPEVGGVHFSIIKNLPQGGGIGGGSSNAAWMINAINRLYRLNAPPDVLNDIASEIGSDVPFFLNGGTAIGRGRGEILEKQPACPKYWLVLMMPSRRMATAEAYRMLDSNREELDATGDKTHTLSRFLTSLYSGDPSQLAAAIHNDFEILAKNYEWYQNCCSKLTTAGALRAFLCGSGSTVAGLVVNEEAAIEIANIVGGIPTSTYDNR